MLVTAILIFLVAAIGGLIMATRIFSDRTPPVAFAVGHGLFAATGLLLLLWMWAQGQLTGLATAGLVILVLAAIGGFFLLSFHVRGKPHPKPVVVVHASVAVIGVGALLLALL